MSDDEYADQAKRLVDEVIENAILRLQTNMTDSRQNTFVSGKSDMPSRQSTFVREDFDVQNISWLSIDRFTVQNAENKIKDFIKVNYDLR
jgi:hypothetical protein